MPISRQGSLAAEVAEVLAIQALGFIAQDDERLGRFLALTGMGPAEIRTAARERHFLAGVLDYVTGDEELLVAFAGHAGVDPETIAIARRALAEAEGENGEA
jgi:Protein of unknown function (DUF3572)